MASEFLPKQLTRYEAHHLAELQGSVSEQIIEFFLGLTPPIEEGAVVHDNACGGGAVTETILNANPPTNLQIFATDLNPNFVAACHANAQRNGWPVTAEVMRAQDLKFEDSKFTHSLTSLAFHCLGDQVAAARQVYRTLQPGGVAVATVWTDMPHVAALHHAHFLTRGRDGPLPTLLPEDSYTEDDLREALEAGGFNPRNLKFFEKEAYVSFTDLGRWSQLAWSYLGSTPEGWSKVDEDRWDEAVEDVAQQMKGGQGLQRKENGNMLMRMVACVAIATK